MAEFTSREKRPPPKKMRQGIKTIHTDNNEHSHYRYGILRRINTYG